ncbi:MAG: T9SS type A sorting domain-containing protein [Flavobacteriales bacterium]|mgnify:CR=1 FL=1|nr:MAG: T9SS type A sorting domain-containing protein [Flavobacteriales bacterium]
MKKIYSTMLLLSVALAGNVMAQSKTPYAGPRVPVKRSLDPAVTVGPAASGARSEVLWESDFSAPGDWAIAHDGPVNLDWQIGTGLASTGDYPTPAIESTTAANGYAMYDSDAGVNTSGNFEYAHITNAASFSTAGYPNVIVEFQTQYRRFNNEQTFLVVSTNNTDWPTNLEPGTDISGLTNVFHVFAPGELTQGVSPGNPVTRRINISSAAGDQPQVWIRFLFVGIWGYTWYVDDVKVLEQPAYDLVLQNGFLSHTGNGEEYGRVPSGQLNPTMRVGGDFFNFGVNPMTNVALSMTVAGASPFNASSTPVDLNSGVESAMDQDVTLPNGGALAPGVYNAVFALAGAESDQEEDVLNNAYLRNFEVNNDWYTLDGIGNHPAGYEALTSAGTNSFTDATDGLVLFNYYEFRTAQMVYGMEIGITSTSQVGSYFIASIYDTTLTADTHLDVPLYSTDVIDITQAHIDAGKVTVIFPEAQNMQPGGYFFGIQMYSNGGANNLRVVDDLTVPQPGLASGIDIPGPADQVYSNGNAYHIRLALNSAVGMPEQELTGVSLYPNPANGIVNFRTEAFGNYAIQVLDPLGREVLSTRSNGSATLDLRGNAAGLYLVRITDGQASTVQRITLN